MIRRLLTAFLALTVATALPAMTGQVSPQDKKSFLKLLGELPIEGEFFTESAIDKMAPYTWVLLALTEEDIQGYDIYPFAALSRGLLDRKKFQRYGVKHFSEIAHPQIKLFWAAVLFDQGAVSPAIVHHLNTALESPDQAHVLAEICGPGFDELKDRVKAEAAKSK